MTLDYFCQITGMPGSHHSSLELLSGWKISLREGAGVKVTAHEQRFQKKHLSLSFPADPSPLTHTPWVAPIPGPHHRMGHTRFKSGIVAGEISFMLGVGEKDVWERAFQRIGFCVVFKG